MSRPSLHELLSELYSSKEDQVLIQCLLHEDHLAFMKKHSLQITQKEFVQAFTHTSFTHEYKVPHQEQLEFLGDSVLQLILTDELYQKYPGEKEGHLSKLRSAIVNEKTLATMASSLGLSKLILVGKGEFTKKLYEQNAVLADTFEALLAQVYRHHGFDFTKKLFISWLTEFIPNAFDKNFLDDFDAKSKLQEAVLSRYKKLPKYSAEEVGDEFEVSLWINEKVVAKGVYPSKKIGEKDLAGKILKNGNI